MKKVNNFFPHDFKARNDSKLVKVNMEMGMEGIGIYWCIIESLYEAGGALSISDIDTLSFDLHVDKNIILKLIKNYDLFQINNEKFFSKSVTRRLSEIEKISKTKSNASKVRWQKQRENEGMHMHSTCNANGMHVENICNAKKRKENKIKENKKEENILLTTTNNIYQYIEKNFGRTLSPVEVQEIDSWLLLYKQEIIEYAIKICVFNSKRTFNYADGILKNWKGQDLNTLEEIKEEEAKRNGLKHRKIEKEDFYYNWLDED